MTIVNSMLQRPSEMMRFKDRIFFNYFPGDILLAEFEVSQEFTFFSEDKRKKYAKKTFCKKKFNFPFITTWDL